MKKIFLIVAVSLIAILNINTVNAEEAENYQKLRAGTFIKVMTVDEFSTLTADIEDEVKFINTQDMYVYETNAVPKGTILFGEIEDVREPVEGKDGALKIFVNKMITPDKKIYKLKAYVYGEEDNYLGGRNTPPILYHKTPHFIQRFRPMLQVSPLHVYEMGKHTVVKPGAELFVILEEDVILK